MPFLRYSLDIKLFAELQALVPDATVTPTQRRIELRFEKVKHVHAFLDHVAADEDLIREVTKRWHFVTMPEEVDSEDGLRLRLRYLVYIDPKDLRGVVAALRDA